MLVTDEEQWLFNKLRYCGPVSEELTQLGYASYLDHYVRSYQRCAERSKRKGEAKRVEQNWLENYRSNGM